MSQLRVVFVDFDGVLNDHAWSAQARGVSLAEMRREFPNYDSAMLEDLQFLDPSKVMLLSRLVEKADASIVLSTSWTWATAVPRLASILYDRGLRSPERVIGSICEKLVADTYHNRSRWEAIQDWVERVSVKLWVALDDCDLSPLGERFIWTSPATGLTTEDVDRALELLEVT